MIRRGLRPRSPDTRERHKVVSRALEDAATVLDVGGRTGELASFLPRSSVTTANVRGPADVLFSGETLPFDTDSFVAATSLDVLEHIWRERRGRHLEELVRVARERVVVCCPLGTPEHVAAERELAARRPHPFLEDHLAKGLPTEQELHDLVAGLPFSFHFAFHGDFRRVIRIFELAGVLQLLRPPDLELRAEAGRYTNRVFLFGRAL
jgi:SAM-dependent methyltransferase